MSSAIGFVKGRFVEEEARASDSAPVLPAPKPPDLTPHELSAVPSAKSAEPLGEARTAVRFARHRTLPEHLREDDARESRSANCSLEKGTLFGRGKSHARCSLWEG